MSLESLKHPAKTVVEKNVERPIKSVEGLIKKKIENLPDEIGEKSYFDDLPDEIGEKSYFDNLPDEIGEKSYFDNLPDEIGEKSYFDNLPDEIDENDLEQIYVKRFNDIEETERTEKKGGSYGEILKERRGESIEIHHMPADSISNLERYKGPAIEMEKADHRQTASWGNSREAREYRMRQRELIDQGKFREALQMDIDDIREKFGDKYDDAISEMLEYVKKLEEEGRI